MMRIIAAFFGVIAVGTVTFWIWSRKRNSFEIGNLSEEDHPQEPDRQQLLYELYRCHRQAQAVRNCEASSKLLKEISPPLQYMLGLVRLCEKDRESGSKAQSLNEIYVVPDTLTAQDLLKESVIEEIVSAMVYRGARMEGNQIILQENHSETEENIQGAVSDDWSDRDIEMFIQQYKAEIAGGQVWVQQKKFIEAFSPLWSRLKEFENQDTIPVEKFLSVAREIRQMLESCGIYPIFYDDPIIQTRPELKARFVHVGKARLVYPALTVKTKGGLKIYGTFTGTYQ